ncbi:PADC1 protein, partial [Chordeiles acutipennis]|nr:PADC1 protein [Chordeiles acutipennis]
GLRVHEYLYFQVLSPGDIRYIFTATPAKDFGGVFTRRFLALHMFPKSLFIESSDAVSWKGPTRMMESNSCPCTGQAQHSAHVPQGLGQMLLESCQAWGHQHLPGEPLLSQSHLTSPLYPSSYMIRRSLEQHGLPWAVISIPVNITSIPTYEMMQPPWTFW